MINRAVELSGGRYECGVVNCARCGGLHDAVIFIPFRNPAGDSTHWAMCPSTDEPILFHVKRGQAIAPRRCKAPREHPAWCGCPAEGRA